MPEKETTGCLHSSKTCKKHKLCDANIFVQFTLLFEFILECNKALSTSNSIDLP